MKVLIVKTSSMGDLIHTLPAVTDARKAIPGIQFDWIAEESFIEIPGWHPAVNKVIPIAMRRWGKNISQTFRQGEITAALQELRDREYDIIIDAQGLIKSAIVTRFSRGVRYGMDRHSCREPLASFFYQHRIPVEKGLHAIERVRLLFSKVLGYTYDAQQLNYGLDSNVFKNKINQRYYVVFLHATSWKTKLWAVSNWVTLAELAGEQGYKVLLPWGNPEEKRRAIEIEEKVDNAVVLPRLNLRGIAEILANARGIVGLDTGLAHLGAALNIPGITLYIATSPALTGAMGNQQICLSMYEGKCTVEIQDKLSGSVYIKQITAEIVWNSLKKKLL